MSSKKMSRHLVSIIGLIVILFLGNSTGETQYRSTLNVSSNILFIIGMATYSHRTVLEPLAHKLVELGHNVTFLTPIKPTKPNPKFHEVSTKLADKLYDEFFVKYGDGPFNSRLKNKYFSDFPSVLAFSYLTVTAAESYLNSPEFKPWVDSSKFDLVILENGICKFGLALAYKFRAPLILYGAGGFWGYDAEVFGVPSESSWLPNYFLTNVYTEHLTFYDRVYSTVYPLLLQLAMDLWAIPKVTEMVRRALDMPDMPSLSELEREANLVFTNQYFSHDYARSLPPFIVQVGGAHCEETPKKLPKDLEEFIAGSGDDGFIYISFGSTIRMSKVPDFFRQIFFDTFTSLKIRFLIKWDEEPPKNLSKNVFATQWFSQQDVLAHSKIKGFVTQSGLLSIQQAIYHEVPMILLPVFGDQPYNAMTVAHHKIGIHLPLSELSAELLKDAISNITTDPDYARNAKRASQLFKDRPLSAVDTAVYWTEYVLRHRNTSHLKPLALYQSWWKRRLLDVWLFVLIAFLLGSFTSLVILRALFYFCLEKFLSGGQGEVKKTQ